MNRRMIIGVVVLLALPASLAAFSASAPQPQTPTPTAFGEDDADLLAWKEQATAAGLQITTVVSGSGMALHASDPGSTLLVIPQPRLAPSGDVLKTWHDHLERGGSMLILDGAGTTNRFLVDFDVAVTDRIILSPTESDLSTVAANAPQSSASAGPVLSQSPSALVIDGSSAWTTLLQSTQDSFLDIDRNGRIDRQDIPGPHAVAASRPTEEGGRLMLMSSTTFLANRYFEDPEAGNSRQILDLVTEGLPAGATILIDESHHGWSAPENQLVGVVQKMAVSPSVRLWAAIGLLAVAGALAFLASRVATVDRYRPHGLASSTVEPSRLDATDGFFAQMADELLARRTGQDTDWLDRAKAGDLRPDDKARLIQLYDSEVNQHA